MPIAAHFMFGFHTSSLSVCLWKPFSSESVPSRRPSLDEMIRQDSLVLWPPAGGCCLCQSSIRNLLFSFKHVWTVVSQLYLVRGTLLSGIIVCRTRTIRMAKALLNMGIFTFEASCEVLELSFACLTGHNSENLELTPICLFCCCFL